jgi:hypothetical protein
MGKKISVTPNQRKLAAEIKDLLKSQMLDPDVILADERTVSRVSKGRRITSSAAP